MKKKIIFSNYDDRKNPYYGGGGAIAVHAVASRLVSDFDVQVITGRYPGSKDEVVDNVSYIRIGPSWTGPKLSQLIFSTLLPLQILFRKFDFWIESFTPPFSSAFLPYFSNKPVVGLVHLLSGGDMAKKYGLPFDIVERVGLMGYKDLIVLTNQSKTKIIAAGSQARIEIIPNGLDKSMLSRQFEKNSEHILYIGRIDFEQKGLDLLLEAFKYIEHNIREKLFIAGSGAKEETRQLKEKIKALGLEDSVIYVGKVTGAQKEDLYKKSYFIVMPSRFETLPLTLLEAFSFKCPALIFDIEDLKWVPEDCAVKVPPFGFEQFGKTVVSLLNDKVKLKIMQEQAGVFAQNFDWDNIAKKYKNFLMEI